MSDLNVQVEELSPVVRRLRVDVPAERVNRITDSVYQKLGRTVKLRGFRQGHVPRRVLEKYFADRVRTDVAREVVQSTFPEALGETHLSPVAEPTLEPEELKPGEAFRYSARVEVRPEVKVPEYKGLEVSVPERKVSDQDVENRLAELREGQAEIVPLEGRDVAEMGDFATVDYEIEIAGRRPQKRDGGLIRLEPGQFLSGNGEKLVGLKVGEVREFSEAFPADRSDDLRGREAKLKVTLTGLKRREVPALDDELARDLRGVDTLDELRKQIRDDLERHASEEQQSAVRAALVEKLIEKNPLEVPPALVESAAERMATSVLHNVTRGNLELPNAGEIIERLKKEVTPKATSDVKSFFLLDALAKAEKIEVSPEDLEKKIEKIAEEEHEPSAKVAARYRSAQSRAGLEQVVRNDKVMDLIQAAARVTLTVPEAKAESNQEVKPEVKESGAPT
jgi:trigger factor